MSLNPQKINPVAVYDPRLLINNERDYAVLKGAQSILYKKYATTSISNSSLTFACPPPSGSIIVDRKVKLYCPIRLTLKGTPAINTPLLQRDHDAPRAFGLMKSLQTMICTINNQSVSINMADVIGPLLQYNNDVDLKMGQYSVTPTYQDQYQEYSSGVANARNSLGLYGDTVDETMTGNAGFPNFVIVQNPISLNGTTELTAIVDIAFCEPLFISPFVWGKANAGGFYNVTTLDFVFNFLSGANGNRFWSHDDSAGPNLAGPITSATFQIGGTQGAQSFNDTDGNSPLMFFQYLTPNQQQIVGPMTSIPYPLFDILSYQTTDTPMVPGAIKTIIGNNIQLGTIPRRMYIYAREQNQDFYNSTSKCDAYMQITGISMQYQNQSGLFSSASQIQLFEISKKNHYGGSFAQWSGGPVYANNATWGGPGLNPGVKVGTIGTVLCLEFGTDLGLQDVLDAPGKLSASTLQLQVTCKNIAGRTITPTLFVVTVVEGIFEVESLNRSTTSIGVLTSRDILDAMQRPGVNYQDIQEVNGGDFWSGLKDFGQKIHGFVKDNKLISRGLNLLGNVVPEIMPLTRGVSTLASSYGYGEGEGGVLTGGRRGKGGVRAGVLVGGKAMSHRSLQDRMHDY